MIPPAHEVHGQFGGDFLGLIPIALLQSLTDPPV
jgi:hypothetical protein